MQSDREFHALLEHILTFVITCFSIQHKLENMNEEGIKKCISGESDDEGASTVLEFILCKQVQFKMYIYKFVENSTGYPNI